MSVSPNELLSQAKALLATASTELDLRNTIGRELAYRLSWPRIPETDPRSQKSRDIGRHLRWLHHKRIKADYELSAEVKRDEAIEVIARVERVVSLASF